MLYFTELHCGWRNQELHLCQSCRKWRKYMSCHRTHNKNHSWPAESMTIHQWETEHLFHNWFYIPISTHNWVNQFSGPNISNLETNLILLQKGWTATAVIWGNFPPLGDIGGFRELNVEVQAAMSDLDKQKMRFIVMCSSSGCQKDIRHV